MKHILIAMILCPSFLLPLTANANEPGSEITAPPEKACSELEFRQLDFWVGEWNLSYDQGPAKPKGTAHNSITRNAYGNCVIHERFTMPGFRGMSVSTYHKQSGKWRQTWVDDQGGYYDLIGGPAKPDENFDFSLELVHPNGIKAPWLRMVWQNKDTDHLTWRWQSKGSADGEWVDRWVLDYEREKSNASE